VYEKGIHFLEYLKVDKRIILKQMLGRLEFEGVD
jgi:hypothetical protein